MLGLTQRKGKARLRSKGLRPGETPFLRKALPRRPSEELPSSNQAEDCSRWATCGCAQHHSTWRWPSGTYQNSDIPAPKPRSPRPFLSLIRLPSLGGRLPRENLSLLCHQGHDWALLIDLGSNHLLPESSILPSLLPDTAAHLLAPDRVPPSLLCTCSVLFPECRPSSFKSQVLVASPDSLQTVSLEAERTLPSLAPLLLLHFAPAMVIDEPSGHPGRRHKW